MLFCVEQVKTLYRIFMLTIWMEFLFLDSWWEEMKKETILSVLSSLNNKRKKLLNILALTLKRHQPYDEIFM